MQRPGAKRGIQGYNGRQWPALDMADSLYLNLWFPSFSEEEMMPRALSVLKQFPYSASRSGIAAVAVHPLAWDEPLAFQQTFDYGAAAEEAIELAREFLHDDSAYVFEVLWDLWTPGDDPGAPWSEQPRPVQLVVLGTEFDEGLYREDGHIQVDFGLDTPFLWEDLPLTPLAEARVKQNIQKLVGFSNAVEKNCGISGRVLWSESEENLAQKLIARLQRTH